MFAAVAPRPAQTPEDFTAAHPGAAVFIRENTEGRVLLAVSPQRLMVRIEDNAQSEQIVGVLKDACEAGHIVTDDFSALVDITGFTGVLDWQIIPKISEVMPKGDTKTNRNAYIVRNQFFVTLTKINNFLFPDTQHAAFISEAEARQWLGWE